LGQREYTIANVGPTSSKNQHQTLPETHARLVVVLTRIIYSTHQLIQVIFNCLEQGHMCHFTFFLICVQIIRIASFPGQREYSKILIIYGVLCCFQSNIKQAVKGFQWCCNLPLFAPPCMAVIWCESQARPAVWHALYVM
jgi:hypothetical protein